MTAQLQPHDAHVLTQKPREKGEGNTLTSGQTHRQTMATKPLHTHAQRAPGQRSTTRVHSSVIVSMPEVAVSRLPGGWCAGALSRALGPYSNSNVQSRSPASCSRPLRARARRQQRWALKWAIHKNSTVCGFCAFARGNAAFR